MAKENQQRSALPLTVRVRRVTHDRARRKALLALEAAAAPLISCTAAGPAPLRVLLALGELLTALGSGDPGAIKLENVTVIGKPPRGRRLKDVAG